MEIRVLLGLSTNLEHLCISSSNIRTCMDIDSTCCNRGLLLKRELSEADMYVQVGLITSYLWLVLSRFVHCMSVVSVAMYCQIEWCIGQLSISIITTMHTKDWNFHVAQWWQWPYRRKIVITHGKDI